MDSKTNTTSTCHESHRSSSSEVSGLTAAKNMMLSHERVTLWFFNMAMEHGPFLDVPYIAMLNNQRATGS
jgi:hypothetical protein